MIIGYVFLTIALVLNAAANIIMKVSATHINAFRELGVMKGLAANYLLGIGLFLFALNVVFYLLALSKLPLYVAYPTMTIGGIAIITLASILFINEKPSLLQIGGIALAIIGILVLLKNH